MSIAAMNWVWKQELPPTPKLVLLSMGDASDDDGVCWPSVPTLARKCCISYRSVQRIMRGLEASGKIHRDPRFRKDGSQTSNRYILALNGGDKLSGPPDDGDRPPGQDSQAPGDRGFTPRTTTEPSEIPPLPPPQDPAAAPVIGTSTDRGGGDHEPVYPQGLTEAEQVEAKKMLDGLQAELAQQLLDELAGRMEANTIYTAPLTYLRGLISRARDGTFTPEMALRIADKRRRQQQTEATLRQDDARRKEALQQAADTDSPAQDNPLAQRMASIGERMKRRGKREE